MNKTARLVHLPCSTEVLLLANISMTDWRRVHNDEEQSSGSCYQLFYELYCREIQTSLQGKIVGTGIGFILPQSKRRDYSDTALRDDKSRNINRFPLLHRARPIKGNRAILSTCGFGIVRPQTESCASQPLNQKLIMRWPNTAQVCATRGGVLWRSSEVEKAPDAITCLTAGIAGTRVEHGSPGRLGIPAKSVFWNHAQSSRIPVTADRISAKRHSPDVMRRIGKSVLEGTCHAYAIVEREDQHEDLRSLRTLLLGDGRNCRLRDLSDQYDREGDQGSRGRGSAADCHGHQCHDTSAGTGRFSSSAS